VSDIFLIVSGALMKFIPRQILPLVHSFLLGIGFKLV
jgi:hypothetical protein